MKKSPLKISSANQYNFIVTRNEIVDKGRERTKFGKGVKNITGNLSIRRENMLKDRLLIFCYGKTARMERQMI